MNIEETLLKVIHEVKVMYSDVTSLRDEIEKMRYENAKLIENEKDLMSVSTIVATKNENTRLTNEIELLKKSLESRNRTLDGSSTGCDNQKNDENDDEDDLFTLKHKGQYYLLNGNNEVFTIVKKECKGEHVGHRIFDDQKKKHKVIMFENP
jgi:hypothetical protein